MTHARFPGLWRFALTFYRKPGIPAACLALQEHCGADVPLALFALHVGISGRGVLPQHEIARIAAALAAWNESVVRPLRAVRVAMKTDDTPIDPILKETLRASVKRLELQAERLQMMALSDHLPPRRAGMAAALRRSDAQTNLANYLATLGNSSTKGEVAAAVSILLCAI
jgi:uncharacterized protein (TIGR02444 family)